MVERINLVSLSLEEFQLVLGATVREELKKHLAVPTSTQIATASKLFTRKEAAAFLGVSLVTLGEWTKQGVITGYRVGTRVRYKESELVTALQRIASIKHKRK